MLGTRWSEYRKNEIESFGFLGLRSKTVASPPIRFLDWTIDGEALRDRLVINGGIPCDDVTFLVEHSEGDRFAIESLKALLGVSHSGLDPWVEFVDGRAGLLFCHLCGDLGCGAVSAKVVFGDELVEWRAVSYQDGVTGAVLSDGGPAFSLIFNRVEYESLLRTLLDRWDVKPIR
ncbi:hypothetical protein LH407_02730 [Antiquaquibacter oligotrophicus]|uniref:hypothetical protein n=1 Tax=Antiquaquibacter oligotrophicus TaxID=2880260 RepID=UPI002AC8C8AA|nr:hypothetical protein [Antiquaquibacter oligotrophicus]UDF13787.1 hypothetical protein LH407_02730 [Antiquaquibacter oligotrophicus]